MMRDLLHWQTVAVLSLACGLLSHSTRESAAQDEPTLAPVEGRRSPDLQPIPLNHSSAGNNENYGQYGGGPDLFYNYYAGPGAGQVPAQMYLAPMPVPKNVGHVYYTYQPFMPHELLYPHYRQYWNYYGHYHGNGGCQGHASVNKTTVRYQRGTIRPTVFRRLHPPRVPFIPCP